MSKADLNNPPPPKFAIACVRDSKWNAAKVLKKRKKRVSGTSGKEKHNANNSKYIVRLTRTNPASCIITSSSLRIRYQSRGTLDRDESRQEGVSEIGDRRDLEAERQSINQSTTWGLLLIVFDMSSRTAAVCFVRISCCCCCFYYCKWLESSTFFLFFC